MLVIVVNEKVVSMGKVLKMDAFFIIFEGEGVIWQKELA